MQSETSVYLNPALGQCSNSGAVSGAWTGSADNEPKATTSSQSMMHTQSREVLETTV